MRDERLSSAKHAGLAGVYMRAATAVSPGSSVLHRDKSGLRKKGGAAGIFRPPHILTSAGLDPVAVGLGWAEAVGATAGAEGSGSFSAVLLQAAKAAVNVRARAVKPIFRFISLSS